MTNTKRSTDKKMLTSSLKRAIQDCATYPHGFFIWKPKSMEKLEAMGYARKIPHAMEPGLFAWEITEEGLTAWKDE